MHLRALLDQTATGSLRRIAEAHGLALDEAATRPELVERVAGRLLDGDYVADRLRRLSAEQRQALAAARAAGGELRGLLLARSLGSDDAEAARVLVEQGLLFRAFAATGPHRGEIFTLPDELFPLVGEAEGARALVGLEAIPEATPPASPRRRATDPLFSLFALASFLQRDQPASRRAASDAGALSARFRREVEGWSVEPGGWDWQERWSFLRHLSAATGLLRGRRGPDGEPARIQARAFVDRAALVRRLWTAYLQTREWSEVARAGIPHGEELGQQVDPPSARAALLGALRNLPPGRWVRCEEVVTAMERITPGFLREQLDARSAALINPASGVPLFREGSWREVEGVYLRFLLLGPLYWLGVIGTDEEGNLVRVTAAGAALLRDAPLEERATESCVWQSDDRLAAPARADLASLLRAERFLRLVRRGPVSVYALDAERVAATLQAGGSAAAIRSLLVSLTASDPPEAIQERLRHWESAAGALHLRPAVLLEGTSRDLLDTVLALEGVRGGVRRRIGETVAEVAGSRAVELAEAMQRAGHLPRVDASLRLMAGRRAYPGLVDEQVLEFLLLSLLAFRRARPEALARLEGALNLLDQLEALFPADRLQALRLAAANLSAELTSSVSLPAPARPAPRRRRS